MRSEIHEREHQSHSKISQNGRALRQSQLW